MTKSIKIWRGRLEITEYKDDYVLSDKNVDLIIHTDKLEFKGSGEPNWLWLISKDDNHIGSIWINTDTDMKKIKKFLAETK